MNQPPRPGNEPCKNQIVNRPGHPSFKRGNFFEPLHLPYYSWLDGYALKGVAWLTIADVDIK
jgi:hypothetical protein